jgi:hypothetical protein
MSAVTAAWPVFSKTLSHVTHRWTFSPANLKLRISWWLGWWIRTSAPEGSPDDLSMELDDIDGDDVSFFEKFQGGPDQLVSPPSRPPTR